MLAGNVTMLLLLCHRPPPPHFPCFVKELHDVYFLSPANDKAPNFDSPGPAHVQRSFYTLHPFARADFFLSDADHQCDNSNYGYHLDLTERFFKIHLRRDIN